MLNRSLFLNFTITLPCDAQNCTQRPQADGEQSAGVIPPPRQVAHRSSAMKGCLLEKTKSTGYDQIIHCSTLENSSHNQRI